MELRPCVCGETDFDATSSVAQVGGSWVSRYTGRCTGCGRDRSFEFRQPDQIAVPPDGAWAPGAASSELLDAGESIRTVSDYLGHADPGFTLRTYTHLVPSSEGRARQAVDRALTGQVDRSP